MKHRLSQQDITDYALNELSPSDRLYVESMMLSSEALRNDASEMMEISRALERGFQTDFRALDLTLDSGRRSKILQHMPASAWQSVGKLAAAFAALAACVAFSVAAPVIWTMAHVSDMSASKTPPSLSPKNSVSALSSPSGSTDAGWFSFQISGVEDVQVSAVLLPTGNVGFMEMPLPSLQVELN
jgi:hypothetical protein